MFTVISVKTMKDFIRVSVIRVKIMKDLVRVRVKIMKDCITMCYYCLVSEGHDYEFHMWLCV